MKYKKKYIILILIVLATVSIILFSNNSSLARYVSQSFWDYFMKSKEFYFTSDSLSESVTKNADNLWTGESILFNIKNSINDKVASNINIEYEVVCNIIGEAESYTACKMNGTNLNTVSDVIETAQICNNTTSDGIDVSLFDKEECEQRGYEYIFQPVINELYFDIVLTESGHELKDVVVNVNATSSSPYVRELKGIYTLHKSDLKEDEITMNFKNYTNYSKLIISNSYMIDKCVELSWNSDNLAIHSGSSIINKSYDQNGYINKIKFIVKAKDSINHIFDTRDFETVYDLESFEITEAEGCQ